MSGAEGADRETRARLLEAADRVVRRHGFKKTSMGDVALEGGVARGTLYRHFDSREALFDALMEWSANQFFREVSAAMDGRSCLSDQLGECIELVARATHPGAQGHAISPETMARMLGTNGAHALRKTAAVLRPYLEAARERGEVRRDLDVPDASEWLARILLSFTIFQASIAYAADDPASVRRFVQRYAIRGLDGA